MIHKKFIKAMVKNAYELQKKTRCTMVVFNIYSDSVSVLDSENDLILDVTDTEEEAIDTCNGVNSGEFSDDGSKSNVYYKPILIDADTGERITKKNISAYLKK